MKMTLSASPPRSSPRVTAQLRMRGRGSLILLTFPLLARCLCSCRCAEHRPARPSCFPARTHTSAAPTALAEVPHPSDSSNSSRSSSMASSNRDSAKLLCSSSIRDSHRADYSLKRQASQDSSLRNNSSSSMADSSNHSPRATSSHSRPASSNRRRRSMCSRRASNSRSLQAFSNHRSQCFRKRRA